MENRSYALVALGFLIAFTAAIVAVILWLRRGPPESRVYDIVSKYSVSGLQVQAAVKFKGLPVGHVRSIGFVPGHPEQVLVRIAVHPDTYVTTATRAELSYQGLTGLAYVSLVVAGDKPGQRLSTSASKPARIPMQQGLIQYLTSAGKPDARRIGQVLSDLNELLDEGNRRNVGQILAQLDEATRRAVALERALQPTLRALPGLAKQGGAALRQSKETLAQAGRAAKSLRELGDGARQLVRELSRTRVELDAALQQFQKTVRDADRLSRELRREPESVIFGAPSPSAGPGEPGFQPPQSGGKH